MSGIVGIYYRDGRLVQSEDLERMLQRISVRGPDGSAFWRQGSVGMGHCMLWTTPESLTESLPWTHPQVPITITADARLDNRSELLEELSLDPQDAIPDSQLILSAYLRWGVECPQHLLGDFAFVIWDGCQQCLYCARDPMGVRPFYLHITERVVAFASEIRGLFGLAEVPRRVNECRIAEYLVQRNGSMASILDEQGSTLYEEIVPLPAGHWMRISEERVIKQAYWELDPEREIRLGSDQECAEAFREIFTQAVSCRLRSAYSVGVLLSGGLDSSSVACTARDLMPEGSRLPTFSAIFPNLPPEALRMVDERPYLRAVLDQGGFESHVFEADRLSPLRQGEAIYTHEDECLLAPNFYLTRHAYGMARERGVRVMLDGLDGDTVVCHGIGRLLEMARSGEWLSLARQMRVAPLLQCDPWGLYWHYLWGVGLKPRLIRGPLRRLWPRRDQDGDLWGSLLDPEFAKRVGLEERIREQEQVRSQHRGVRGEHYRGLCSGLIQTALQAVGKAAAEQGVEARHPFFDRRLVEFCLALPADQKLSQGWTRIVLRRAMDGIVPQAVQWRVRKADLTLSFHRGLIVHERDLLQSSLLPMMRSYMNVDYLQRTCKRAGWADLLSATHSETVVELWLALNLSYWSLLGEA